MEADSSAIVQRVAMKVNESTETGSDRTKFNSSILSLEI